MEDRRYSMCIAITDIYDEAKQRLFRIADLQNGCFQQSDYQNTTEYFNPKQISFRPGDAIENEVDIWEWTSREDNPMRQISQKTELGFYEVIFPFDVEFLDKVDDTSIRNVLRDGFVVPAGLSSRFLLVIGKIDESYQVLICNRAEFLKQNNTLRLPASAFNNLSSRQYFHKYKVNRSDVFDTSSINIYISKDEKAPTRNFYKYCQLGLYSNKFFISPFEHYIPLYIRDYVKILSDKSQFSKKQRREIQGVVECALSEQIDYNRFFQHIGFEKEEIKVQLINNKEKIQKYFLDNNEFHELIRDYIEQAPEFLERCREIVKSDWLKEKDDERTQILNEIEVKNKELSSIKCEIKKGKLAKVTLENEVQELDKRKSKLESSRVQLESQSKIIFDNIKNSIEKYILDNEVYTLLGQKEIKSTTSNPLLKYPSVKEELGVEVIEDLIDFIDNLQINLEASGINNEFSFDLAQYIYATFANKMGLLLVGYNTRKIADAISYSINGASAEVITLPIGYCDCNELVLTVSDTNSKVILIENAIDYVSEGVYIPLMKQNIDKFILFSMESSENIAILPKSILSYVMLVDLDTLLGCESDSEIEKSIAIQDIFEIDVEIKSKKHNLRHLKGIGDLIKLSNVPKFKIAEVMSIIDKLDDGKAMYDILLFSINLLCHSQEKTSELMEFVEKQQFNPTLFKTLESILKDGIEDE